MEEKDSISPGAEHQELLKIKQQYAYLQADFDNYRKRMELQRSQWMNSAQLEVITPLLDIMDDFERAQGDINNPAFDLMFKAFKKLLQRFHVTEIEDVTHFDPSLHEAIMQTPVVEGVESGTIARVLQKGYRLDSTIIRPAKVSVYE